MKKSLLVKRDRHAMLFSGPASELLRNVRLLRQSIFVLC
jgi:hypothetical protein